MERYQLADNKAPYFLTMMVRAVLAVDLLANSARANSSSDLALERGLEEVHEQLRRLVQLAQRGRGLQSLKAPVAYRVPGSGRRSSVPPTPGRSCDRGECA